MRTGTKIIIIKCERLSPYEGEGNGNAATDENRLPLLVTSLARTLEQKAPWAAERMTPEEGVEARDCSEKLPGYKNDSQSNG